MSTKSVIVVIILIILAAIAYVAFGGRDEEQELIPTIPMATTTVSASSTNVTR